MRDRSIALLFTALCSVTLLGAGKAPKERLPLPGWDIPDMPAMRPSVVTAGGRRLLLGHTGVVVSWHPEAERLASNRSGWWIINYPLSKIAEPHGLTADEMARKLFGRPAKNIENWYLRIPGEPAAEPSQPKGPAPIELTRKPTIVVDQSHPKADDGNEGTADVPLKTIQAALDKAKPGDVIQVMPGVYRESVEVKRGGAREKPIVIEGVRDGEGHMPVITGNDPFPKDAWRPVTDVPGIYRADIFTKLPGTVSVNGKGLIERSHCRELKPGEYCFNHASREALQFRVPSDASPQAGETVAGMEWLKLNVDDEGFLNLADLPGGVAPNSVYYAFTYVWIEPKKIKEKWDPRFPEPVTKRVYIPGDFRAGRQTGTAL